VDLPGLKLIEVLLVVGGLVAFVWWQMRELRIDGEKTAADTREREAREAREALAAGEAARSTPAQREPTTPAQADAARERRA
jgi:hypothetical protein